MSREAWRLGRPSMRKARWPHGGRDAARAGLACVHGPKGWPERAVRSEIGRATQRRGSGLIS